MTDTVDRGTHASQVEALAAERWRIAVALTAAMVVLYFGFVALIAYRPDVLARRVSPGMTVGIVLGVAVIVISWLLTHFYVRWTNRNFDARIDALRDAGRDQ